MDASPSFNARVQAMCAVVPSSPASTIHSQVMPTGVSHTNSAGTSDIGTHSSVV